MNKQSDINTTDVNNSINYDDTLTHVYITYDSILSHFIDTIEENKEILTSQQYIDIYNKLTPPTINDTLNNSANNTLNNTLNNTFDFYVFRFVVLCVIFVCILSICIRIYYKITHNKF